MMILMQDRGHRFEGNTDGLIVQLPRRLTPRALACAAWKRTHSSRPEERKTLSFGCAILVFPIIYAAHRFERCSAHDEQPLRPLSVLLLSQLIALLVMALMCSTLITLLFRLRDRPLAWQKGLVKW